MKRLLKISGIIIGSIVLVSILSSITQRDWLTILSALLMPTVAGITTYIAIQQYKLVHCCKISRKWFHLKLVS